MLGGYEMIVEEQGITTTRFIEMYFITVNDNCKKPYFAVGYDEAKKVLKEESEKLIQKTIKINHLSRAEAEKYRRDIRNKTIHDKNYMTISDLNGKWEVIMHKSRLGEVLKWKENKEKTMDNFLTMDDVLYVRENWASQDAKIIADETTELKEEYLEEAKKIYNILNIIEDVHYDYRNGTSRTFYLKQPYGFCYWSKAEIKLELYGYIKEMDEAIQQG